MDTMACRTLLCCALLLAGCSGGDVGVSVGSSGTSGELAGAQGMIPLATAPYLVLDIASGEVTGRAEAPDLADPRYTSSAIVFRRVDPPGTEEFLIAVCEITQAQWTALGGTDSWTAIDSGLVGAGAVGAAKPAFGLSLDSIDGTLSAYRAATGVRLEVPSDTQWGGACAGGGSGVWAWGSSADRATVEQHARVWETLGSGTGPLDVASLQPNGYGLYDVHGNVWEWTAAIGLRGGSWHDPIWQCRISDRIDGGEAEIDDLSAHALFGLRPILRL